MEFAVVGMATLQCPSTDEEQSRPDAENRTVVATVQL